MKDWKSDMGAGASSCLDSDADGSFFPGIGDLPEDCVALVLKHLDPPEICRLARLNKAFRGAASADFVWDSKLPNNYSYLLEKIRNGDCEEDKKLLLSGKKEIYSRLCRPNTFDGGDKVNYFPSISITYVTS